MARSQPARPRLALLLAAAVISGPLLVAGPAHADEWRDQQYWLEEYGFEAAWETTRGEGVTVAVIDTGIDAEHPDLVGQVSGGVDVSGSGNEDGTAPVGPMPAHGTLVASVLAGHGNNAAAVKAAEDARADAEAAAGDATAAGPGGAPAASPSPSASLPEVPEPGPGPDGVIGVAPEATLLSVSVDLGATGSLTPEDQIAQAVTWAVDHGADIINISLGSTRQDWPRSWDEAFLHAEQNDVVVVAAAGNRASGTETAGAPATIPGVLTVAGLNQDGTASWDSSTEGISIGVAAPADPLVGAAPGGQRQQWAGTSGAAPLVAGLAALVRSAHPELPAHQVIQRILSTATDAGVPGVDPVYGHGIIDASAAVTADVAAVDRNPMDTLADWIRVHRRAESSGAPSPSESGSGGAGEDGGGGQDSGVEVATDLPQAAAPQEEAPALQPALVLGTGAVVLGLAGAAVVLGLRQRGGGVREGGDGH